MRIRTLYCLTLSHPTPMLWWLTAILPLKVSKALRSFKSPQFLSFSVSLPLSPRTYRLSCRMWRFGSFRGRIQAINNNTWPTDVFICMSLQLLSFKGFNWCMICVLGMSPFLMLPRCFHIYVHLNNSAIYVAACFAVAYSLSFHILVLVLFILHDCLYSYLACLIKNQALVALGLDSKKSTHICSKTQLLLACCYLPPFSCSVSPW